METWKERRLYHPESKEPFRLSRSKIELFLNCPRCFYYDRRHGESRPSIPGFTLNSAVDALMKKEFDLLRREKKPHELMTKFHIDAIPFDHPDLPIWRDDMHKWEGASVLHPGTNMIVAGIIDDVWVDSQEKLHMVDYKSTSTQKEISLEDEYKQPYKRQIEIYQWIFRRMGLDVSDIAYFVFANATKNRPRFDARLEFDLSIIAHKGNDSWVEPKLFEIAACLRSNKTPPSSHGCEYCQYRDAIAKLKNNS